MTDVGGAEGRHCVYKFSVSRDIERNVLMSSIQCTKAKVYKSCARHTKASL